MAKPVSNPLTRLPAPTGAGGAGLTAEAGAGREPTGGAEVAGRGAAATVLAEATGGRGGGGAPTEVGGGTTPAPVATGGGPPGGRVGSLIVAVAEDGLGGKLMRTVSFLG